VGPDVEFLPTIVWQQVANPDGNLAGALAGVSGRGGLAATTQTCNLLPA
jgi:hypothetical protein